MKSLTEYLKQITEAENNAADFAFVVKDEEGCIIQICDTEEDAKAEADKFSKEESVKASVEKIKRSEIEAQ